MSKNTERKIRNKKIVIALMEYVVTLGCLLVAFVLVNGNKIKQENSYARPEEVSKYVIEEDEYITRIRPLTEYNTFKEIAENSLNKRIVVYKDERKEEEVTRGYITSGMVIETVEGAKSYKVSVVGDLNNDGDCNVTELTRIIRSIIGLDELEDRGKELSADINGDDRINVVDVTMSINYIVYGEMEPDEEQVREPRIEVRGEGNEEIGWYRGNVEVEIEGQGEGIAKIQTVIEKDGARERTEEREIELTDEGTYKITSQSYGTNGTKSGTVEKEINIDKTEPEVRLRREDVDRTQCKIVIEARDNRGIRKYGIQREGEEERNKEGINEREIRGTITIRENGRYKVIIEDQAGNTAEKEIEITGLNDRYTVRFVNEDESIIREKEYAEGDTVETPANPTKPEDNIYTYEFIGWTVNDEEVEITEETTVTRDIEYKAAYRPIYRNYTVTFKQDNGTIISTKENYHYGDVVEIPENPTKASDDVYTYEFKGWDKEVSETVEGNIEYKAVYEKTYKEYRVVFKQENGEIIRSTNYHYGEEIELPTNPIKQEDNMYTYEFKSWVPEISSQVTGNLEYTATYEGTFKDYRIRFLDEDGSEISNNVYHYDDDIENPTNPTKPEDNTYTYEFKGWDKEVNNKAQGNIDYTATYEAIYKEYIVRFLDEDGREISYNIYHYNDDVEIPTNPTKQENNTYTYEFTGWDKEVNNKAQESIDYTATYEGTYKEYTVRFLDEDGREISNNVYHYNDDVEIPEDPTKQEDNTYTYEFTGWDKEINNKAQESIDYTATYEETYKEYTVRFLDEDGREISNNTYHYNDDVEIPTNPTKQENNTYTYEFIGWDKEINNKAQENIDYTATYEGTYKEYTVRFLDEDGREISNNVYHYNDDVEIPEDPTKQEDNTYTYEFTGWDKEINNKAQESIDYTATYEETFKEYTVRFLDEDGSEISNNVYHYNDDVEVPANPTKVEDNTYTYEFKGWDKEVNNKAQENIDYTATYEGTFKEYTVRFLDENGIELSNRVYHYGDNVMIPEDPTKPENNTYTYEFRGWDKEVEESITKSEDYTATYEATYKEYLIVFKDENEEEISRRTYHYGDTVEIPDDPTKEEDNTFIYEFKGWGKEVSETAISNEEYVAQFDSIYKEYTVTFKQDTGSIINTTVYHYGDEIEIPEDPVKESTVEHAYEFLGWSPEVENTATKSIVYTATYEEMDIRYNFIFFNDDGVTEVSRIENYTFGNELVMPETPSKEETDEVCYKFIEWLPLGIEEVSKTVKNISFKANYEEVYFVARLEEVTREVETVNQETGETETTEEIVKEGKSYLTLREAIEEARTDERTIRMLHDTEESVLVEDNQKITLNLNGKTITSAKVYGIKNYGDLLIKDTTRDQEGRIYAKTKENIGYAIHNRDGKITMQSGMIVTETEVESSSTYGIYNQSEQPLILEGGFIIVNAKGKNSSSYGVYNLSGQDVEVTGGNLIANSTGENSKSYGIYNSTNGRVNITSGRVESISSSITSATSYGVYNILSENITITGGTILAQASYYGYGVYNTQGTITVNGGIIEINSNYGYGIYVNSGKLDMQSGTISVIGSDAHGIYNRSTDEGIEISGCNIEMLSSGRAINNFGKMNVTGGTYSNRNRGGRGIYSSTSSIESYVSNVNISNFNTGIYNEYGKLNISDAIIDSVNYGIYNRNGTLETDGCEITNSQYYGFANAEQSYDNPRSIINSIDINSNGSGIYNYRGETKIYDANIVAKEYGINCSYPGTVEIGIKDNNISTEKPYIYGKKYAISSTINGTSNIKYYDGILKGGAAIYGGVSEIETNSRIVSQTTDENEEIITLQRTTPSIVAKIGTQEFSSLESALNEAMQSDEEKTITIVKDYDISSTAEILQNKNIILDLNGHTVRTYARGGIINKGTLEIKNSSEDPASLTSTIGVAINNEGKVTLKDISINSNGYGVYNYNNGEVIIDNANIIAKDYGVYNSSSQNRVDMLSGRIEASTCMYNYREGTINMYDGQIVSTKNGYGIYGNSSYDSTVNIFGGEIEGYYYGVYHRGNLKITGGKIKSKYQNSYSAVYIYNSSTCEITGGEFEGYYGIQTYNSNLTIGEKGNSINVDIPYIKGEQYGIYISNTDANTVYSVNFYDGKILGRTKAVYGDINEIEDNSEIKLETEVIDEKEYKVLSLMGETVYDGGVAQIGETTYNTVSNMNKAISEIETNTETPVEVKILNDFETNQPIQIIKDQNIKIDLNGKTITSNASIINRGTLEITDTSEETIGKFINNNGNGINNYLNLTVSKGNIEGVDYGIQSYYNNITIGYKDGIVNSEDVTITGTSRGITGSGFKMYDGKIIGKSSALNSVTETEEGYMVFDTKRNDWYTTAIKRLELEAIAKIGEEKYYDLFEAVYACKNGQTIDMLKNVTLNRILTIPEDKVVLLNLGSISITSSCEKTIINNGSLEITANQNSSGYIYNYNNNGTVIENRGNLNIKRGYLQTNRYSSSMQTGKGVDNYGVINLEGGSVYGYTYGIYNNENGKIIMKSGGIEGDLCGIYNNSTENIEVLDGSIYSRGNYYRSSQKSYGIYNNVDANINVKGGSIYVNSYDSKGSSYGIYNKENGDILISSEKTQISTNGHGYGYGILNEGSGTATVEQGLVKAENCSYIGYAIKNTNNGKIILAGGKIEAKGASGMAYGIDNGINGNVEITSGYIDVSTTNGISYGIMTSDNTEIKNVIITAKGNDSYGIYRKYLSNLVIGENDGEVRNNLPIIDSEGIGIYSESDASVGLYDGKLIGNTPINADVNIPEGHKLLRYYDGELEKDVTIIAEQDDYVLTYYSSVDNKYTSYIIKAGEEINDDVIPVVEDGYNFSGWNELPEIMPAEDVNVYATIVPKSYNVTYFVDGEQYGEIDTFDYNSNITAREVPTKEGCTFSGWSEIPETMPAEDIEVRGNFTYTATFYAENRTSIIQTVPFTVEDTEIEEPEVPTKEGYKSYWSDYEFTLDNIEIELISVENNTVVNKTKRTSYANLEEAIADLDSDGSTNELYLYSNIETSTVTIPENANVILDLNGYSITNNTSYCGIHNYGNLIIKDSSSEKTSIISVEKENTNVYGIYNEENSSFTIESGDINVSASDDYSGVGVYNGENSTTTLGIFDKTYNIDQLKIEATTYAIDSNNATINFYDGKLIAKNVINGEISNTEFGYVTKIITNEEIEEYQQEKLQNYNKMKATDENGITWNYQYYDGTAQYVYYDSGSIRDDGYVEIPETLDGYKVVSLYNNYSYYWGIFESPNGYSIRDKVKHVKIPEGVTYIYSYAFRYCSNLEKVELPSKITSISSCEFTGCSKLKKINIPNRVTSIGETAFSSCSSLESIDIPDSVTSISKNAFSGCTGLKNIKLPNKITKIPEYMLSGCTSLENVEIPENVTEIEQGAFNSCSNLTNIEISKNVITINGGVFSNCTSLINISVAENNKFYCSQDGVLYNKFKTKLILYPRGKNSTNYTVLDSVKTIGNSAFYSYETLVNIELPEGLNSIEDYAFYNCKGLTNINIPDGVTSIGNNAFYGCIKLTSLELPEGIVKIDRGAFANCSLLEEINIPNTVYTLGESLLSGCEKLTSVQLPENLTRIENYTFSNCKSLESIEIPNNVTIIGYQAFSGCEKLTSLELPQGLTKVENYAFQGCKSIENLTLPNNVSSIGYQAFTGCEKLKNVELSESLTVIESGAFSNCKLLERINIPISVNTIKDSAFSGCESLTSIELPEELTKIENYTFNNCKSLQNIDIPSGVTSIGYQAFYGCEMLTSVYLPEELEKIEGYAFYNCKSLENIVIPNSVIFIGSNAFFGCEKITTITLSESLEKIESSTFYNCKLLNNVVIPSNVKIIDSHAFYGCEMLTSIELQEGLTKIGNYAFYNCISLEEIDLPSSVNNIGTYVFYGCDSLNTLVVSDNNEYYSSQDNVLFNKDKTVLILYASMKETESYSIPDGVTEITNYAFNNCNNLIDVYISSSVTKIEIDTFYNCNNLESIEVSEESESYLSENGMLYSKDKTILVHVPNAIKNIEIIESEHPYKNNLSESYKKTIEGASSLKIKFVSKCQLERNYDYISIYDKNNNYIYSSSYDIANNEFNIQGDTVRIDFRTDRSGTYWGFKCIIIPEYN